MGEQNIDGGTVEGFGEEWATYDQSVRSEADLRQSFDRYFSVFPWDALPETARGFDAGCGSGRWAVLAAPRVGGLVAIDPPEPMVNSDLNQRVQGTVQQFQAQGIDLGQWLAATGQEPDQFVESMRGQSEEAVKVDLALRAVADAEEIVVEAPELEAEFARMAMQYQQKARDIRRAYEQNDAIPDLVASIRKSKALDWLIHHLDFVDTDGNPIGRDELLGHGHDEHGNHIEDHDHADHDHDHDEHDDHDHDHDGHDHATARHHDAYTSTSDQDTETDS